MHGSARVRAGGVLATLVLLAGATPVLAQRLGQAPEADFAWVRWLGALLLCLALAIAGALALRARLGVQGRPSTSLRSLTAWFKVSAAAPRRVRVIESVRASPTLELCLLSLDGQEYLVAATPHGAIQLAPPPIRPEAA